VAWSYQGTISSDSVQIRARGTEGYDIGIRSAWVDKANKTITGYNLPAVKDFDPKVRFFDPLVLIWEISLDNGKTFLEAGTTQNHIYFCLRGPVLMFIPWPEPEVKLTPTPFRTVAHLACSNEEAETADEAVDKTWELFLGKDVKGWNETTKTFSRTLYYYKPGTTFSQNAFHNTASLLQGKNGNVSINTDSGQCSTWACLLRDACELNGGNVMIVQANLIFPNLAPLFLVKDWLYDTTKNAWTVLFNSTAGEMYPPPPILPPPPTPPPYGIYGDLENQASIAGQNSAPPSEKVFENHVFVKNTKPPEKEGDSEVVEYLDPSYAVKYEGVNTNAAELDFQNKAIEMFAIWKENDYLVAIKPIVNARYIQFDDKENWRIF
jgi:hypothetical protein